MTRALPLIGLIILCACGSPTQPIVDFGKGVTIYTDSLYRGGHVTLSGNVSDFRDLTGPCNSDSGPYSYSPGDFDDCVSSLRIPDGWTAVVYRDRDFKGDTATYTADVPDLDIVAGPCKPGFNDCISSMKVFRQ